MIGREKYRQALIFSYFHISVFKSVLEVKSMWLLMRKHMRDPFDTNARELPVPADNWDRRGECAQAKALIWFLGGTLSLGELAPGS